MEYYLASKKKKNLQCVTTWMNLEDVMLNKIGQSHADKYCVIQLI